MSFALITGASKGIGKSIAFELAGKGCSLLLVARSEQLLKELAAELENKFPIKVNYLAIDLSELDAPEKVYQWCFINQFAVSILINNAGYGLWGMFEELTLTEQLNMMQLNMQTMVGLTHLFIPILKKNKRAYILNTASTAAFQAIPTLSVYAATKAFVITFSRGLKMELKASAIKVSCLIPGATDTGFMDRANMSSLKEFAKKFEMSADEVAKIAVAGMFKGKLEIIPGASNIVSAVGTKFLPKQVAENIAAGIYMKKIK